MRLLLDECVDERLRHLLGDHDCQTARYAGFAGLRNSDLISAAEAAGFDVIVTVDQNMPTQQNLRRWRIAFVILCAVTNRLGDLKPLVPAALRALDSIQPGELVRVR